MSAKSLETLLATSQALIDQFSTSLASPIADTSLPSSQSPLPLISASGASLKAQTTKLSLLAINTPFTPSAISTILSAVNESVLPSLITGILLVRPTTYTNTFTAESCTLARGVLRDFKGLLELLGKRNKSKIEIKDDEKKLVTESTGRIWDGCDNLVELANGGIGGLVVKKAQQYQALIQDAIKELEEWDPEEDEDDFFGEEDSDDDEQDGGDDNEKDTTELKEQKDVALKVFQRVPQCIHVIVKNRLQKGFPSEPSSQQIANLDRLVSSLETASEAIDEAAGSLYEQDIFSAKTYISKVKARTTDAVDCVLKPWVKSDAETKEDVYIQRARAYIQSAGQESKPEQEK